ncbi:FixH family protein [Kordiimonas laminariae]|uniref:FixH family protein n=1 Tax=Kordiimonas laminariae TaxID=2917717 RepID=UPI001FF5A651|nr:FixH family protein [Kordiimonas laminariae]MCK0068268.1 FixH family protein [Kordiimonas laminariae]
MTDATKHNADMAEGGPRKRDRLIPWYFVAFFVVLAVLDGIFVYVATTTHTGVVTDDAYNEGLNYNETITAAAKQEALGWSSDISLEGGMIKTRLLDANQNPINGAKVSAFFMRPVVSGKDFTVSLTENGDGHYALPVDLEQGQWNVRVFVEWKQQTYQASTRLVAKQK